MTVSRNIQHFVQDIEDSIYKKELIYRSILVTKNLRESKMLKSYLDYKDYSVLLITDIEPNIDYNTIDERVIVITSDKFKNLILHLNSEGLNAYNFIGFSYLVDDDIVKELIQFYTEMTNNNEYNTIILDRQYQSFLYLENILA